MLAVKRPQSEPARDVPDLSRLPLDLDKPAGVGNVIEPNRTPVQAVLLAYLGICFLYPKIEQLHDSLGSFVFDGRFDFHARLVLPSQARPFEREHGDLPAVPTETQLEALLAEAFIAVEEFVSL